MGMTFGYSPSINFGLRFCYNQHDPDPMALISLRDCFLKPFESEMKAGFLAKNHRIWAKLLDSLGYQQANDSKNRLKKHSLR
jgi:hypothetical protein